MHIQPKVNNARRGVGGHNCPEQDDTESGSERKKEVHDTRTHTYNVGGVSGNLAALQSATVEEQQHEDMAE
ncbi:Uncharacterized protein FWK35_00001072 [Aphis craccivora]|uniref:Uncharacterized protein n=1 Tax=Aphis craccivora TaxID=307492 RepID=A0A6G0ZPC1_APHCR|nr:Uncharacterized protein FWK35_00001072 [Aphis craccivora]